MYVLINKYTYVHMYVFIYWYFFFKKWYNMIYLINVFSKLSFSSTQALLAVGEASSLWRRMRRSKWGFGGGRAIWGSIRQHFLNRVPRNLCKNTAFYWLEMSTILEGNHNTWAKYIIGSFPKQPSCVSCVSRFSKFPEIVWFQRNSNGFSGALWINTSDLARGRSDICNSLARKSTVVIFAKAWNLEWWNGGWGNEGVSFFFLEKK